MRTQAGVPLVYRALIVAYVGAVILFSFRDGLAFVAKGVAAALGAGFLVQVLGAGRRLVFPPTYSLWTAWFALAVVTIPFAIDPALAGFKALTLVQVAPVSCLVTCFLIWHGKGRLFPAALVGAALLACAMVWVNPAPFTGFDGRVAGPLGNANSFGAVLTVAIAILAVAAAFGRGLLVKLACLGTAVPLFVMVLQTGSRMALLGAIIAVTLTVVLYFMRGRSAGLVWVGIAAVILIATAPLVAGVVSESRFWFRTEKALTALETGSLSDADTSLAGRVWLYKRGLEVTLEHPLFGVGLDNFRMVQGMTSGSRIGTYSHSNYIEILSCTGLLGFLLYFAVLGHWLRVLYARRHLLRHRELGGRYGCAVVVVLTLSAMDFATVSYYDKAHWLMVAWLAAEIELLRHAVPARRAAAAAAEADDTAEPGEAASSATAAAGRPAGARA